MIVSEFWCTDQKRFGLYRTFLTPMGMNTYVSTTSEEVSDAFQHRVCVTNLFCCILYALPMLLFSVNSLSLAQIAFLFGTPQVKVYRNTVWKPWWDYTGDSGMSTDQKSGVISTWPFTVRLKMLDHHRAEATAVVICETKHPVAINIIVHGEIADTGNQLVLLVRCKNQWDDPLSFRSTHLLKIDAVLSRSYRVWSVLHPSGTKRWCQPCQPC